MKYCFHVWAGASSCFLELLDKLQKRICKTVGPSLAVSLELLAHRQNVVSLSHFYRYYFDRCSSELAHLVPLRFSRGRSSRYSDRLRDFSATILRCYKVYVNRFLCRTARFWNSLNVLLWPMILVALSLELPEIFNCRFFLNRFPVWFNLFVLDFLVTACLVVAVQPCMEWIPIKNILSKYIEDLYVIVSVIEVIYSERLTDTSCQAFALCFLVFLLKLMWNILLNSLSFQNWPAFFCFWFVSYLAA